MPRKTSKATHRNHGPLPLGDEGVNLTVQTAMIRLALRDATAPAIKAIAARINRACEDPAGTESGDHCRTWGAFRAVVDTVTYTNDPATAEHVTAPKFLMTTHRAGDCDCMTTALASILTALGYATRIKVIAWRGDDFTHVYLETLIPSIGAWVPMDPVYQVPGNQYHGFGNEKTPVLRSKLYDVTPDGAATKDNARAGAMPSFDQYEPHVNALRDDLNNLNNLNSPNGLAWFPWWGTTPTPTPTPTPTTPTQTTTTRTTPTQTTTTPTTPTQAEPQEPTPWLLWAGFGALGYVAYLMLTKGKR